MPKSRGLKILQVGVFEESLLGPSFQKLEKAISYPLGNDEFQIDHGLDYFAFFKRLGKLNCYAAVKGEEIAATGMGILRNISFRQGEKQRRAWYLCDLKVNQGYRGSHLPLQLLRKAFLPSYIRCSRGYAISMNPPSGENRIVKLLGRFSWAPSKLAGILNIYSCDYEQMTKAQPVLEKHRGAVSYLSLSGKKDLVLKSTGKPMPLLHLNFGDQSGLPSEPQAGFTHMFCSPATDPLATDLAQMNFRPQATASIIHHRMKNCDWRFILTSDI